MAINKVTCKQNDNYRGISSKDNAECGNNNNIIVAESNVVVTGKIIPYNGEEELTVYQDRATIARTLLTMPREHKKWMIIGMTGFMLLSLIILLKNSISFHRDNGATRCQSQPEDCYLGLSDEEIFHAFQGPQNKIGQYCYIRVSEESNAACQYYVKAQPSALSNYKGWPRTPANDGDKGTGCVGTSSSCYFLDTAYNLTESERDSFCTSNIVSNAAAQLRHAIQHHACGFQLDNKYGSSSTEITSNNDNVTENIEKEDTSSLRPPSENQEIKDDRSWWNQATDTVSGWLGHSHLTKLPGGGRDWLVHAKDGTLMSKHDPSFFLGYGPAPLILVSRNGNEKKLYFLSVSTNDSFTDFKVIRIDEKDSSGAKQPEFIGFIPQKDIQETDEYKYYDTLVHPSLEPFTVNFKDSNFIITNDGFILDVAYWNIVEGNKVNFVKPVDDGDDSVIFKEGGGRDWSWNEKDGTISPKLNPDLVLGVGNAGLIITQDEEHTVRLSNAQELANGESVFMNLDPLYNSNGPSYFVSTSSDEKKLNGWRYREAIVQREEDGSQSSAVKITYDGNFILTSDNNYALDIASWKMEPWTSVNFVGGDK